MAESPYPEHDKLAKVRDKSQVIGEFLDFGLPQMGLHLDDIDEDGCSWPTYRTIPDILADYFGIDQTKLEAEKAAILEALRAAN